MSILPLNLLRPSGPRHDVSDPLFSVVPVQYPYIRTSIDRHGLTAKRAEKVGCDALLVLQTNPFGRSFPFFGYGKASLLLTKAKVRRSRGTIFYIFHVGSMDYFLRSTASRCCIVLLVSARCGGRMWHRLG